MAWTERRFSVYIFSTKQNSDIFHLLQFLTSFSDCVNVQHHRLRTLLHLKGNLLVIVCTTQLNSCCLLWLWRSFRVAFISGLLLLQSFNRKAALWMKHKEKSCIMGNIGPSIFGACPIPGTKSQSQLPRLYGNKAKSLVYPFIMFGDTAHIYSYTPRHKQSRFWEYSVCFRKCTPNFNDLVHKILCTQTHTHLPIHTYTHTQTLSLWSCRFVCVGNNLSVPRSRGNQLECEIENKQSFQIVKPFRQPASPSLFEAHRLSSDHIQIYSIAHVP